MKQNEPIHIAITRREHRAIIGALGVLNERVGEAGDRRLRQEMGESQRPDAGFLCDAAGVLR